MALSAIRLANLIEMPNLGTIIGYWWQPHAPKVRLFGTLDKSEGRYTVKLAGHFHPIGWRDEPREHSLIFGESIEGHKFTLVGGVEYFAKGPAQQPCTQILATLMIMGGTFRDPAKVPCKTVALMPTNLVPWLGLKSVSYSGKRERARCEWDLGVIPVCRIPSQNIRLSFRIHDYVREKACIESIHTSVTEIHRFAAIQLTPRAPITLQRAFALARDTLNLMRIVGRPDMRCYGFITDTVTVVELSEYAHEETSDTYGGSILHFPDIRRAFDHVANTWYSLVDELSPVVERYIEPMPKIPALMFQSLLQTLEFYHRRRYIGTVVGEEQYQKVYKHLLTCIPAGTPAELRTSIESKLKYGNEMTLRARLRELMWEFNASTRSFLFANEKAFLHRIVDLRNRLNHPKDSIFDAQATGFGAINQQLLIFARLLLLKQLGVAESTMVSGIRKNNAIFWLDRGRQVTFAEVAGKARS